MEYLIDQAISGSTHSAFVGMQGKEIRFHSLEDFLRLADEDHQRPKEQWWLDLQPIARVLAQPAPSSKVTQESPKTG